MDPLKVFILGSERSGTSITYYAMRHVFALPGPGESHVFPIFVRMIHQYQLYADDFRQAGRRELAARLDTRSLRTAFSEFLRDFYSRQYPNGEWVDKTPGAGAISGATMIYDTFPDAKIILTKRTGVEVVQSFRAKFSTNFDVACKIWLNCTLAAERAIADHPEILVIDQYQIANQTVRTAEEIAERLGRPEKAKALADFFATNHTDQMSTHAWDHRLTAEEAGWNQQEKEIFEATCGETMRRLGYPY